MSERPNVPKDTKLMDPPDDVDEDEYWDRVRQLHSGGMPWFTASKLARQEAVGARHVGGPILRPWELG